MDERTRRTLKERAERYAAAPAPEKASRSVGTFVGCRVAGQSIGLPISVVEEFGTQTAFTPLPGIDGVLGATQLRGEFLSVVDLGACLLGKPADSGRFMLVLTTSAGKTSALVDEIFGQRVIFETDLLPPTQFTLPGSAFLGMSKDFWLLADTPKLIRALDQTGQLEPLMA